MKYAIINHKRYAVEHVFNMVGNWYFTDKHGAHHLVDGEDVSLWSTLEHIKWDGVNTAIAYAKYISEISEDGVFWWKVK